MHVSRRPRRPRTALLLTLLLLIPLSTLAAVTGSATLSSGRAARAAEGVQDGAASLASLMTTRVAILDEYVPSAALAQAAGFHVTAAQIRGTFGVDYLAALRAARRVVDSDLVLRTNPALAADLKRVRLLRPDVDSGHARSPAVSAVFTRLTADIDSIWFGQFEQLRRNVGAYQTGSGRLTQLVEVTADGFTVLSAATRMAADVRDAVAGNGSPPTVKALIEANSAFVTAATGFPGRLGPRAAAAWRSWQRDPAAIDWGRIVSQTVDLALAGKRSPLAADALAYGAAFIKEPVWLNDLTDVLVAAAADMQDVAHQCRQHAVASYQSELAIFGFSLLLVITATLLLSRAIVRPLRRLAAAARNAVEGTFSGAVIAPAGPREVADTIAAVDDMTAVLAAVEDYAVTLAADPTAPALDVPLPGRTGLALQTTLDRLRESILAAERQRRVLSEVAAEDGLTGLLNRRAAFEAVSRELSRVARERGAVVALFIDLDGLKTLNDNYGHQAGDQAIQLAARALQSAARSSDVVGRIGGDEFLIAGAVHVPGAEVLALAQRAHAAVDGCSLETAGQVIGLTCSIGIGLSEPGDDVEALVRRADVALYRAKTQGRNRVGWARATQRAEPLR